MSEPARLLATALADLAPFWRTVPFYQDPPWVDKAPARSGALLLLSDAQLGHFDDHPTGLQNWLVQWLPELRNCFQAADACLDSPAQPPPAVPEALGRDVPGRKWQQLLHFAAACESQQGQTQKAGADSVSHFVEWCSGKAHLGRWMARRHGRPVFAIEHDEDLCAEGARLARRDRLPITYVSADALAISPLQAGLDTQAHALALHACGDLHIALMRHGSAAGVPAIDIAPCCYHLTQNPQWTPLSAALADSALAALGLRSEELRLAVQETVTASARTTRQQQALAVWRLGFDALQRELRGIDSYLHCPPRSPAVLAGGFPAFCADMAAYHGLHLPAGTDFTFWLQHGQTRHARIRRLDLLRHAFRRPLEVLLVADRALSLAEAGYQVSVRPFCPRELTPRNLLIKARRH